jgi:hypothetical protein
MHNNRVWHLAAKKMAGEATVEEIRELESLLKKDPDMHYALQNVNDLWQLPAIPQNADDKFSFYNPHGFFFLVFWFFHERTSRGCEHSCSF